MSKKAQRVSYVIGVRNALNSEGKRTADGSESITYSLPLIRQLLGTLDEVLKLDGITAMPVDTNGSNTK